MKNVILLGYGKMGSSIAKAWDSKLNFNFFVVEKVYSLRNIAIEDGFSAYEDLEQLTQFVKVNSGDIFFWQLSSTNERETIQPFEIKFKDIVYISSWFINFMVSKPN